MPTPSVSKQLKSLPVTRDADEALREAVASGDSAAFQQAWLDEFSRPLKRIRRRLGRDPLLCGWSVDSSELSALERELAASLDVLQVASGKKKKKQAARKRPQPLNQVLAAWAAGVRGVPGPWEALAVAEVLLREGSQLDPDVFVSVFAALSRGLQSLWGSKNLKGRNAESVAAASDAVQSLLVNGEAALVCGLVLSPLEGAQELQTAGRASLQRWLHDSTDDEGHLHGALLFRLPEVLAPLARGTLWADVFHQPLWEGDDLVRVQQMLSRACMLATPPISEHRSEEVPLAADVPLQPILQMLLETVESRHASKLARLLKKTQKPVEEVTVPKKYRSGRDEDSGDQTTQPEKAQKSEDAAPLQISWQSDTVSSAVLRTSLQSDADVIMLDWHGDQVQLQIFAGGIQVFAGPWHWSVQLDEKPVAAPTSWKCSCWFDDAECVFIELEGECGDSLKCIRQIMLATRERFAMLTDSVTTSAAQPQVQLTTALPLAEGAVVAADSRTRELVIGRGLLRMRAIPVWLEDDRVLHALGQCVEQDGQLISAAPGAGGVTIPLALDWHPGRADAAADWARLTVTEARRYNGAHEAAGFRVRVGDFQVLLYRSLMTGVSSRACLGLHTWDETVYTRIPGRKTPMEGLVEVESPE